MKDINSVENKLQEYKKWDHDKSVNTTTEYKQLNERKHYCEGLEVEIIELRTQVEEERKVEEGMRKKYMEKEDHCQGFKVEVRILKIKLIEKYKHLKFRDSAKILDNLLNKDPPPSNQALVFMYIKG